MLSRRAMLTGSAAAVLAAAAPGAAGLASRAPLRVEITFDADAFNVDLRAVHDLLFGAPIVGDQVAVNVLPGVTIASRSPGLPALDVGSWPAGVAIEIDNRGTIGGGIEVRSAATGALVPVYATREG